ncbi:hypothetical protein [Methylocystis parvus]|uniref:Cysteine rich repeat protein n=1 Tax=Methylocystis parvus TaxID=134 RepID=A0A6B8M4K2_9HYPH|nr:hypothetical protein [Methylocystis parvus]QGM97831.1 hypothetical protein F7D14_10370 [Methylocystis parvus]WBK01860.1 hypothetical protein MMG94_09215 [Methylocystis parvus OBBP]
MHNFIRLSALLALLAAVPAMAQGTQAQRDACEDDAKRLCQAQIPDVTAIEGCLRAAAASLTDDCRSEMGLASPAAETKSGGKKKKR